MLPTIFRLRSTPSKVGYISLESVEAQIYYVRFIRLTLELLFLECSLEGSVHDTPYDLSYLFVIRQI